MCSDGILTQNTGVTEGCGVIERELALWSREFLVRPEGSTVLKLPPSAQVSKLEARIAFRETMEHSNLAETLVAPLMYMYISQIVEQSGQQLGRALDTAKL